MASRQAVLGFLFGVAVVASGFVFDPPPIVGWAFLVLIFGGWLVFAVRDRRNSGRG
jgi:hypothetical protein